MNWKLSFVAFTMLFLAELGDKTQLAVFTLTTQHKQPLPIFIGASLALTLVTLIAAYFGNYITRYVPIPILHTVAGLLFLGMGIFVLKEAFPVFWTTYGKKFLLGKLN
ncbi:MAG: TMEM165/GDT1 family protein [Thermotaleaceae bacterium]